MVEKGEVTKLLPGCLAGDRTSQEQLVLLAQKRVYYHCKKMLKQEEDALDATQEILISMLTNLGSLREPAAFWGWLSGITANYCRNVLRRRGREVAIPEDEEGNSLLDQFETQDEQLVPEKALDNDETRRMVVELVDNLPEAQRLCVLMYYYDEMSVRDIAAALETSEGTIKSRLNYARKAIKEGVERYAAQGIKLYSFSPLPFLLYFLQKDAETGGISQSAVQGLAQAVLTGAGSAAVGAAASGAAGGAAAEGAAAMTGTAAAEGAAAATGAAGSTAAGGAAGTSAAGAAKAAAGLGKLSALVAHKGAAALAGLVLTGAVAGGVLLHEPPEQPEPPAIEVVEPVQQPDVSVVPEPEPEPEPEPVPEPEPEPQPEPEPEPEPEPQPEPEPGPEPEPEPEDPRTPQQGIAIWPRETSTWPGSYLLSVSNLADGTGVPQNEVTWTTETPDLVSIDSEGKATLKGYGTAVLSASWNGYTAKSTIHIMDSKEVILLTTVGRAAYVDSSGSTSLQKDSADKYGEGYTVEWSVDNPILTLEPQVDEDGTHWVRFYTKDYGVATITCTVTWPDGTVRRNYCNVYVCFTE